MHFQELSFPLYFDDLQLKHIFVVGRDLKFSFDTDSNPGKWSLKLNYAADILWNLKGYFKSFHFFTSYTRHCNIEIHANRNYN